MVSETIHRRLSFLARLCLAHGVTFALFLLTLCSFSIPHTGQVRPFFLLMAIYYWSVFRPTLVPPSAAFLMGLMVDFLSSLPAGLTAGLLVAVQWIVRGQRRYLMGQSYVVLWTGFAMVSFGAAALQWGVFGLTRFDWPPVEPILAGAGLTVLMFPLVVVLLQRVHRLLPMGRIY